MNIRRPLAGIIPVGALAAIAIAAAGCGGSSSAYTNGGGSTYDAPPKPATGTLGIRQTKLGRVLVDARGDTLYLFEKDRGAKSSCYGACASIWPPLTTGGAAKVGTGVTAAKLASTKRSDGKTAITYGGHPLYTYAGDKKPGETKGQGLDQFGAEWYVLAPSGNKIDNG